MAILSVRNLNKSFIDKNIITDGTFHISRNEKIGLVGSNGSGKTTLFRILSDEEPNDTGDIYIREGFEPSYLKQHTTIDSTNTIYQEVITHFDWLIKKERDIRKMEETIASLAPEDPEIEKVFRRYTSMQEEYTNLGGPELDSRIKGVLKGLGFSDEELDQQVNDLSGGQKSRVELAKLLLSNSKFLLLDEPTNHLDMDAINWLEGYLRDYDGAYIIISHDRYFLDRTVDRILLLERGHLYDYKGNYSTFSRQRKKDLKVQEHQYKNQQRKLKAEQEVIDRYLNTGKANIYRQGLSRQRRLENKLKTMDLYDPVTEELDLNIHFRSNITPGRDIYRGEDLTFGYTDENIFENIDLEVYRKDRIGLIGGNGVGKTTLLKILEGSIHQDSGELAVGTNVDIGYFDQEMAGLDRSKTIIDDVWDSYPTLDHQDIRSYLARINYVGDDVFKVIDTLSGGEQSKIALLKLMMSGANVLLMDEPTNHLDIDAKETLEESLDDYDGTVIAVSHDRYFLNSFSTKIWEMSSTKLTTYLGNYDYYVAKKSQLEESEDPVDSMTETERANLRKKERQKTREAQRINRQKKNLEEKMELLDQNINDIDTELYKPEIASDYIKATELANKKEELEIELLELFDEWEKLDKKIN